MRIEAFIIHLDRAVERKANVERLQVELARLTGLKVHVLSAVDGKALSKAEIDAVYQRRLYKPYYPFDLSSGEVACFLSHRKCWQEIVDRGLDAAFIVEDDVELLPDFARTFPLAFNAGAKYSYVRFPNKAGRDHGSIVEQAAGIALVEADNPGLGTVGQMVYHAAAAELLARTEKFDRPVDVFVQSLYAHSTRVMAVLPPSVRDGSSGLGQSFIQVRTGSAWSKVHREFFRFLFRTKTRLQNRKTIVARKRHARISGTMK